MKKERKCKVCPVRFIPNHAQHIVHGYECLVKYNNIQDAKRKKKVQSDLRKEKKEFEDKSRTRGQWLKRLERVFNAYIRHRDRDLPCISCGTTARVKYDAGHYWPAGNYSFLRFNEDNVHKQCSSNCNVHKGGNRNEYRVGLIKKIGQEKVDWLEANRHKKLELTTEEIKELIEEYRIKLKAFT